jgi:DNA-binding beta-propeller fold protein YncE
MHIIPDLKKLEAKYSKELVVIGVHSAKFANERETGNIREAILRYELEHPVINDAQMAIWKMYVVNSWPTLVLIDPEGKVVGGQSGEGIYDIFDKAIGETITKFSTKINRTPMKFALEKDHLPASVLGFPGKIAADEKGRRLFITDSNNNRVVILGMDGKVQEVIGEGEIGLKDGSYTSARFFRPQGLCYDGEANAVYVADTENHALRKIDLAAKTVKTLAGNGKQSAFPPKGGPGRATLLSSPWDVLKQGSMLYIAMAGTHQLWTYDLATDYAIPFAGNLRENIVDGALREAQLAQPSGLATDGKQLFFADSEVSALRQADFKKTGAVHTFIGQGLFEFGDIDGTYPSARLQHPLGVAYGDGGIYIADTYNHKIKRYDLGSKQLVSVAGSGKRGLADGVGDKAQLNEPAGLVYSNGKLFVTDTNNHMVRIVDTKTRQVSTLKLSGVELLAKKTVNANTAFSGTIERLPAIQVAPGATSFGLELNLPAGTKINKDAPFKLKVSSSKPNVVKTPDAAIDKGAKLISLPITAAAGDTEVTLDVLLNYCNEGNEGLCYFKEVRLVVPISVAEGGQPNPVVSYAVKGR